MKITWFALIVLSATLAGCAQVGDPHNAGEAWVGEPGVSSFLLKRHMVHGYDVMLNIESNTTLEMTFRYENDTPDEGRKGWGMSAMAFAHDYNQTVGGSLMASTTNRSTVSITGWGHDVEAGPPIRPLVFSPILDDLPPWEDVRKLDPGHYHLVLGVDQAQADLTLSIKAREGFFTVSDAGPVGDLTRTYTTANADDWDDKREIWLSFAAITEASLEFDLASPLNVGWLNYGTSFEMRREGTPICTWNTADIENTMRFHSQAPGHYALEASKIARYVSTFITFKHIHVPGHEELEPSNVCFP